MSKKITILVLLITAVACYMQAGCDRKKVTLSLGSSSGTQTGADEDAGDNAGAGQRILSFNLEGYRKNGQKKWELSGAVANIFSNVIKLDYVTAKAYGDDSTLTLTAKKGVYDKNTKDIHLQDHVVGKSSDGTKIMADSLDWNQKTEKVTTDSVVKVQKDNFFSVGTGAVGSPSLKQVEMKKDVTVEIRDTPPTVITCDGPLVVDYQKNISILKDNVRINDPRGKITADMMKVIFDPVTRKITRVIAIRNVKIQREGNYTCSERAVYSVRDGRVRLVGKPRIVVFPNQTDTQLPLH
ncbi:MAG: LPS export ABC transporter periplasmic protein LptC [Candidatus Omnitrophota bacterium]